MSATSMSATSKPGRVAGKTAIVTGAASGIGRGCAAALAEEGATVILADIDDAGGAAAAAELGAPHRFHHLDVTDEAGWAALVGSVECLDILVNAAGIGVHADLESTTLEMFRRTMAVNAEGVFLGCRAAFTAMKAYGGSLINVSSVAGIIADPGLAAYCASKGAVRMLSKSIALQGAKLNIRCNTVHPSFIDTPMVDGLACAIGGGDEAATAKVKERLAHAAPLGRLGRVSEVAALVVYLASDESSFTTGAEHVIDGGMTAR